MDRNKRTIAATELVLIFPAMLFMISLIARQLQPLQYEPAHFAQQIIMWYAGRIWTLWILLISLPLVVLIIGCLTLLQSWSEQTEPEQTIYQTFRALSQHSTTFVIALTTFAAGIILVIVGVHMLMN